MSVAEAAGQPRLRVLAALLVLSAGAVHLGQVGVHLEQGWPIAGFFVVVGSAQVGASALLIRPRARSWFWFGIAGSATVVGIWVLSRTVGLPYQVGGGIEPVGIADAYASLAEAWTIVILGLYLAKPIHRGRHVLSVIGAIVILGLVGVWLVAARGGAFNADPARLAAARPQLVDWLVAACGVVLAGGVVLGGARPVVAPWRRGLIRGLAPATLVASGGLAWLTLPPTIGQNLDCRYGPLAAVQVGGHAVERDRVHLRVGESRILPIFELRVCGGTREVTLDAVDPVTIVGEGARLDGFWLLPAGRRLEKDGTESLPDRAQSIPPEASLDANQPRQLVVRLVATEAGDYTLGSVRLEYFAAGPETSTFATTVAICIGACPAE